MNSHSPAWPPRSHHHSAKNRRLARRQRRNLIDGQRPCVQWAAVVPPKKELFVGPVRKGTFPRKATTNTDHCTGPETKVAPDPAVRGFFPPMPSTQLEEPRCMRQLQPVCTRSSAAVRVAGEAQKASHQHQRPRTLHLQVKPFGKRTAAWTCAVCCLLP